MHIDSDVYQALYQKLWDEFLSREWNDETYKPKKFSQALWQLQDASGEFVVIKKILNASGYVDERYFYRKYLELDLSRTKPGKINDIVLCGALEYLGFKVPDNIVNKENLFVRASSLLNQFKEKYLPGRSVEIVRKERPQQESESVVAAWSDQEQEKSVIVPEMNKILNELEEKVKSTIISFYENIGSGEYEAAWNLLTPEFQNRMPWQGDASRFVDGYTNTVGIKDVYIFNVVQRYPTVIDAQVYYDDEIAAYGSSELGALYSMTVADLDDFMQNVKRIQKKIENAGGQNFEKIELYKLFEQAASEYIWYKCGIKTSDISKAFPSRRTINVKRLYYCSCKLINDQWLINSIRGVMPQSAR